MEVGLAVIHQDGTLNEPAMSDWPFLFDFARGHRGGRLALATLVTREGSSYRQPGARMLIAGDLSFC